MRIRWDKCAAQIFVRSGMLFAIERLEAHRSNMLRVLAYHRIGYAEAEADTDPSLFSATPEQFSEQMQVLADNYCVVGIEEVVSALQNKYALPPRSVLITFDDAYLDFKTYAWPVLRRLNLPAVLFVPTNYVSGEQKVFWWDRLYHAVVQTKHETLDLPRVGHWTLRTPAERHRAFENLKQLVSSCQHRDARNLLDIIIQELDVPPMDGPACLTWQDIREMADEGLVVGAHTRSHPLLSRISIEEARQEISGSQQDIQQHVGLSWPLFAYPSGHAMDLQPGLLDVLQSEGFQVAVTMIKSHNTIGHTNPLLLKRVGMAPHLSLDEFRLTLTGVYNVYGMLSRLRAG